MKKTFKVLPILTVCVFLLAACGSSSVPSSTTDKGTNQTVENKPPKDLEPNPTEDFDYEYDEELHGVVLVYKGESEQVVFPSEFNGDPVVAVGVRKSPNLESLYEMSDALYGNNQKICKVKEVYIPEGVQLIDTMAFSNCIYLESITIPDSVTTIGVMAFDGCVNLTSVRLPDKLLFLGDSAFYNCVRLTSVHLPENLNVIGSGAFSGCEQLVDVTFESLNNLSHLGSSPFKGTYWQNRQPDGFITLGPNLLDYKGDAPSNLVIPDGIRHIAEDTFLYGYESVKTIKLPESLTNIGEAAFAGCKSLTTINLPDRLTTIGDDAFKGCDNLDDSTKERIRQINPQAF